MSTFSRKLKAFFHDSIDKCLDIRTHESRAREYARKLNIVNLEEANGPDRIASCMERSLLPKDRVYQQFKEIRHPFSNGKIEVSIDLEKSMGRFNKFFETLETISEYEDKKKFFFLWRNLQDLAFKYLQNEDIAKYLPVLPSDTRVPDHSIWEHLKITAAINAETIDNSLLQNNSLLLFTIGPVQSFISQARKTQDFFMGSFILSYLSFGAMEEIINNFGPTAIIYPDLYKQPLMDWWLKAELNIKLIEYNEDALTVPSIPNRFVAIIPYTNSREIKDLANRLADKVKEKLAEIKEIILRELKIEISDDVKAKIDSQLSHFPDIYWTAIPWKIGDTDITVDKLRDFLEEEKIKAFEEVWEFAKKHGEFSPNIGLLYEPFYSALEKSLSTRKNLRDFTQFKISEKGRKCSVCGELDVVFFKESQNKQKFKRYNPYAKDLTKERISSKFLEDGEGLCTLCFIKRTFEVYLQKKLSTKVFKDFTFPSTAEIATADFKESALNKSRDKYFNYQNILKETLGTSLNVRPIPKLTELFDNNENLEGEWFYEENLRQKYISKVLGKETAEEKIEELRRKLEALVGEVGSLSSYYAMIYFDGDNIGKWLSGQLLPEVEVAYTSETWKKLGEEFKKSLKEKFPKNQSNKPRKMLTPAIHASISTALRNFSVDLVRKIVEKEYLGKLIYAGGDDLLALVNLRDLFNIIRKLRAAFSGNIEIENELVKVNWNNKTGFVEKDGRYMLTMGPVATASMGVVIAHYKTPLQIVIRKTFETEKKG
ncbi:type III-B CRISPR-associated protein Cas10/Cmr2 [bacterium]|nr:type III-B CRISPR-associated protein Cas10/Cmr2 [bacterium]